MAISTGGGADASLELSGGGLMMGGGGASNNSSEAEMRDYLNASADGQRSGISPPPDGWNLSKCSPPLFFAPFVMVTVSLQRRV